jgi:type II secretion system protein N
MKLRSVIFGWAGLAAYSVILFLLMTFYRLPVDKIIAASVERLTASRLCIGASKVSPILPPRYRLEDISYGVAWGDILAKGTLTSLILGPDYVGLLRGYLPMKFKGMLPRGYFQGRTGVSIIGGVRNSSFRIKIEDLFLEDLEVLGPLVNRELRGRLNGEIELKGDLTDPTKITGTGRFLVEKGSIGTKIDLPGMDTVPFERMRLGFSIKDGILTLNESDMNGPMFSGNLSGTISCRKKLSGSLLNMTARMTPGPLLKNNQMAKQFLGKSRSGDGPMIVRIGGRVERPSIRWSKG